MSKDYVTQIDGAYRITGTRISLDSVVYAFLNGQTPESIVDSFPLLALEQLAAQGEVIYQDDTPGRVLALIEENQKAAAQATARGEAPSRTGRQTTAVIVQVGERRICLYYIRAGGMQERIWPRS